MRSSLLTILVFVAVTGSPGDRHLAQARTGESAGNSPFPDYNTDPRPPESAGMQSSARELAAKMTLGWNLGNTLEATGGETSWGNPKVTEKQVRLVKANGFDAIRIPASWDQYANKDTAEISPDWLRRVEEVVRYCIDNELYVVLNIHWDGGWLENHVEPEHRERNIAKQRAFWQQIATHFREYDERLMFAGANEPNVETERQMKILYDYHQAFIDAVRVTGGRNAYRVLVVQGPGTDIEKTGKLWKHMPVDTVPDRLMMELHFYTPYNFTLMTEDADWGNQFYYWGDGFHSPTDRAHNPTWGEEQTVDSLFRQVGEQFVEQGIPVILGEFGAMRRNELEGEAFQRHLASRVYYLGFVAHRATAHGLVPYYWDTGGLDNNGSGLFDRRKLEVFDKPVVKALQLGVQRQND